MTQRDNFFYLNCHIKIYDKTTSYLFPATHYENLSMQYTEIFSAVKNGNFQQKNFNMFIMFVQTIDCGYKTEAVLTSTHNLFGLEIRKIGIPLHTPVLLCKSMV